MLMVFRPLMAARLLGKYANAWPPQLVSLRRWRPARGVIWPRKASWDVLELDVEEAVEGLLVGPVEEAEEAVEPEGGLGAELALKGREGRGGQDGRGRG